MIQRALASSLRSGRLPCATTLRPSPHVYSRSRQCDGLAALTMAPSRMLSSPPPPPEDTDFSKQRSLEDANPERIHGLVVNPDGIGDHVLPGNLVYRHYKWTGNTRKVPMELVHGYFWMLGDLKKTNGKPLLTNKKLIPESEAQVFPTLTGLETLGKETTDIPYFFIADENVKCTLVNISFRDSGYRNIDSWKQPFEAFAGNSKVKAVTVSITERWSLYMLRGTLANIMRKNTPATEYDKTLLYFGSKIEDFRDILRMHNLMANYAFLVDDLGRIRFAGSGPATEEDISQVLRCVEELSSGDSKSTKKKGKRRR